MPRRDDSWSRGERSFEGCGERYFPNYRDQRFHSQTCWGETHKNGYRTVHFQLKVERGAARSHSCSCGKPASDWAYQHSSENEKICLESGRRYSENLWDYAAMCRSCHTVLDLVGHPRTTGHSAAIWASRRANRESHATFIEEMSRSLKVTNRRRVKCEECEFESNPGNLGHHRRKTGHGAKAGGDL